MTEEIRVVDELTGGVKGSKVEMHELIPPEFEKALAEHYGKNCVEHGGKYESGNWLKGYKWSLSYGAYRRHAGAFWRGEDIDADSGSHHLIAAIWHLVALYTYDKRRLGTDNRPECGEVS